MSQPATTRPTPPLPAPTDLSHPTTTVPPCQPRPVPPHQTCPSQPTTTGLNPPAPVPARCCVSARTCPERPLWWVDVRDGGLAPRNPVRQPTISGRQPTRCAAGPADHLGGSGGRVPRGLVHLWWAGTGRGGPRQAIPCPNPPRPVPTPPRPVPSHGPSPPAPTHQDPSQPTKPVPSHGPSPPAPTHHDLSQPTASGPRPVLCVGADLSRRVPPLVG